MAIIYKKGQKEAEYTGADKVMKKFGDGLERIKSTAKAVVTRPARAMEAKRKGDATKEIDNINRAFGSLENYEQFSPSSAARNKKLREAAGYSTTTQPNRFPRK